MKVENFGPLKLYTISNSKGTTAKITTAGAAIVSLFVEDKNGDMRDIVLGYRDGESYLLPGPNHGAVCGRVANRIENAEITVGGKYYKLPVNYNGSHMLHGGPKPLAQKVFDVVSASDNEITLRAFLPDGENGFPGNMTVDVTYTMTEENGIRIHYIASCDADTVINLTNHAYFNLRGHAAGNIEDHVLTMHADTFAPLKENFMVYGALIPVSKEFDFRSPMRIGEHVNDDHPQLKITGGYDHAWTVRNEGRKLVNCTEVYCPESGIYMKVNTNSPTILLYTGNSLPGVEYPAKDGAVYKKRDAFCLETGFYPNALKFPQFNQGYLNRGETFDYTTEYVFGIK